MQHIHVDNSSAGELLRYLCFLPMLFRLACKVYIQPHQDQVTVVLPSIRLEPEMLWMPNRLSPADSLATSLLRLISLCTDTATSFCLYSCHSEEAVT